MAHIRKNAYLCQRLTKSNETTNMMVWNNDQGLMLMASLPMMVCAQWTLVLLIDWVRERKTVKAYLMVFMATATLLYAGHYVYFTNTAALMALANVPYRICNLLVYPLFLLYIGQLTQGGIGKRATGLWLLPTIIAGGFYLITSLCGMTTQQQWADLLCRIIFSIQVLAVCWQGMHMLNDFKHKVENYFADTEGRTLRPISAVLILLTVTSVMSIVANLIGREHITNTAWGLAVPSILFSALLFCIGYVGHLSLFSYDDIKEAEAPQDTTIDEEMGNTSDEKTQELAQEVERLVTSRQIFLQHDLRITDIALMLNTNERYVSAAINQVIGCSFSDYINRYRIDYARKLQKEKPDMPASEIAFKAGFKSMSSFYRNMRKAGRE